MEECPFCDRLAAGPAGVLAVTLPDGFPLAKGHTLVVPRHHCADLFSIDGDEYDPVWALVRSVRDELASRLDPDGFHAGSTSARRPGRPLATRMCTWCRGGR